MSIAALPRVTGRHRNHALAGARRVRAQGWTYDTIAQELGYTSRATVHHILRRPSLGWFCCCCWNMSIP